MKNLPVMHFIQKCSFVGRQSIQGHSLGEVRARATELSAAVGRRAAGDPFRR